MSENKDIIRSIKNFYGIQRKKPLKEIIETLQIKKSPIILQDFGQDSAILKCPARKNILFHTDGIIEQFLDRDPWNAGFFGVVVNLKDIWVMGGVPIAMVDVLAYRTEKIKREVLKGLKAAEDRFKVPIVGGHTHPNAQSNALSIAIIGLVEEGRFIDNSNAKPNDDIIIAIDLKGKLLTKWDTGWDSTTMKDYKTIRRQILVLKKIAENRIATSGKDISNAGIVGTVAALLETSKVGALVNLDQIPKPKQISFEKWLEIHPSYGFIYTTRRRKTEMCLEAFRNVGVTAERIGKIDKTLRLKIKIGEETSEIFDLNKEYITGIKK